VEKKRVNKSEYLVEWASSRNLNLEVDPCALVAAPSKVVAQNYHYYSLYHYLISPTKTNLLLLSLIQTSLDAILITTFSQAHGTF
jgi:hypothetical protein